MNHDALSLDLELDEETATFSNPQMHGPIYVRTSRQHGGPTIDMNSKYESGRIPVWYFGQPLTEDFLTELVNLGFEWMVYQHGWQQGWECTVVVGRRTGDSKGVMRALRIVHDLKRFNSDFPERKSITRLRGFRGEKHLPPAPRRTLIRFRRMDVESEYDAVLRRSEGPGNPPQFVKFPARCYGKEIEMLLPVRLATQVLCCH